MRVLSEHACFDGIQRFLAHDSRECRTEMRFSVYETPQARERRVPGLYYLAGLTCTEETFMIKAGAQRVAPELGLRRRAHGRGPGGCGARRTRARASHGCPAVMRAGISGLGPGSTSTPRRHRGTRAA